MNRRNFLKFTVSGATMLGTPAAFSAMQKQRGNSADKHLIVVFQRGGNDGLNTLVPNTMHPGHATYINSRPTLAVANPLPLTGTDSIGANYVGLHPAMSKIQELWESNHTSVAFFPGVHYPDPNLSHFESQRFIEQGVPNDTLDDGWLNRYLQFHPEKTALAFNYVVPHSLIGSRKITNVPSLTKNDYVQWDREMFQGHHFFQSDGIKDASFSALEKVYADLALTQKDELSQTGHQTYTEFEQLTGSTCNAPYCESSASVYGSSIFGQHMAQAVNMIKDGVAPDIMTMETGGWDTHSNQQGRHNDLLLNFSNAIHGACQELHASGKLNNTLIVVMTEFGRQVRENSAQGTDHGEGSLWMAFGGYRLWNHVHNYQGVTAYDEIPWRFDTDSDSPYLAPQMHFNYQHLLRGLVKNWLGDSANLSAIVPGPDTKRFFPVY